MELRHLKHFMVLARVRHFNRAATELNLAQPSLSRSIQKLESLLGVKLLDRNAKTVKLTAYGELVQSHGEKILLSVDCLKEELDAMKGLNTGELVVGASPIPATSILGPVIGEFVRRHPLIGVDLKVDSWQPLYNSLIKGQLSLFIAETKGTGLDKCDDVDLLPLPEFSAVFCCRAGHPLLGKPGPLTMSDLRCYPLAIPRNLPASMFEIFGDLFSKERADFAGLVRFDQFQPIKASLQNCDMLAITPEIAIRDELAEHELISLNPLDMPELKAHFSVVTLKGQTQAPGASEFLTCLMPRGASRQVGLLN
ncbi:LysR family transcriptional regulator [Shewanella corallii]|uniref:LysR family transcriptional regulator n=1 Tax=Shewanella corallii TaxID=560080 RepID=A0ABT0NCM5_9GAMM|nr:LysR family transcriptional regulator [Shewanella corallii]MCL2915845.1 LysR family transcriptional regulator [Shewanella corallii]